MKGMGQLSTEEVVRGACIEHRRGPAGFQMKQETTGLKAESRRAAAGNRAQTRAAGFGGPRIQVKASTESYACSAAKCRCNMSRVSLHCRSWGSRRGFPRGT